MSRSKLPPRLEEVPGTDVFYIRDGKKRTSTGLTNRLDAENCLARYMARKDAPPNDPTISQLLDLRLIAVKGKAREKDTGYFHTPLHKKIWTLASQRTINTTLQTIMKTSANTFRLLFEKKF